MSLRFLPNLLCILRILLVIPVADWILQERYPLVLLLFAVAAFTDGLDGFLAKTFSWTSELGRVLDPLADKLLLVTAFVCLSLVGHAPWWLTGAVLLRDVVIVLGALSFRLFIGRMHGRPTVQSKINTFCQIVFCLAAFARDPYAWPPPWAFTALGALCFVTTCVSGLDYVLIYTRRAIAALRARPAAAGR
ncbi:MAG TPA: CDP-alcohol phosphatidyltransferase family protein [Steroidobacteraceae bacterium]|nr:CDP-alcohol phosphatidyltransferase family protein [Steroidobacteraceae bacterium]